MTDSCRFLATGKYLKLKKGGCVVLEIGDYAKEFFFWSDRQKESQTVCRF
jgi:hypothetical protein